MLAASDAELEQIEISYVVKASSNQNMALFNNYYNAEAHTSMTPVYLFVILLIAAGSLYHFVFNKNNKTPA